MAGVLGDNRYGKSGIRLAVVSRDGDTHDVTDLDIDVRLEGDFAAAHRDGDNRAVLPTDTMRGTCYALARDGITGVAAFGRRLAARFLDAAPAARRATVTLTATPWQRVVVDGRPHPHAFTPAPGGRPVTTVSSQREGPTIVTGGVRDLRLLKTTGSAFSGFLRDEYTTLPETRDRILATTVVAAWGFTSLDVDHDRLAAAVPATCAARFATHDESESVQHTLHAMGTAVLDAHPEITWIRFTLPNEHHVLADLSPYGRDNPDVVFVATDRPFGVIEGTLVRDGAAGPATP
ncbi:MAG TPA: urate oxidase [Egibacteraceae bacterium]